MKADIHIDNHCLIEGCKQGDKEAMSLFYTRFAPRMLGVIKRYVADPKDAEDILHDGFIVAFTRLASLKEYDKVELWLAAIMKNLSLQFLHDQDIATMLHDLPEVADTPEFDDIIDIETLETLIAKLPPGYQKVFRLAVLENKSHKEIARILGIAPNSSSSQLFHARLMMRQLIKEHRRKAGLLSLLLLVISGVSLWIWDTLRHNKSAFNNMGKLMTETRHVYPDTIPVSPAIGVTGTSQSVSNQTTLPASNKAVITSKSQYASVLANNVPANNAGMSGSANTVDSSEDATSVDNSKQSNILVDDDSWDNTIVASEEINSPESSDKDRQATYSGQHGNRLHNSDSSNKSDYSNNSNSFPTPRLHNHTTNSWSVGLGVNVGSMSELSNDNRVNDDFLATTPPAGGITGDGDDQSGGNGDDEQSTRATRSSYSTYQDYNSVSHHNYLPLSVSLSLSRQFSKIIGIETGLTYTYLHSKFETSSSESHCHWHYLGVPLKLDINIYKTGRLRTYASVGGAVNIPLYSVADVTGRGTYIDLKPGRFHSPVTWSVGGACGVGWCISGKLELFIEPTLQYHFGTSHHVPNSWIDNPASFSLPLGLRLTL